MAEVGAVIPPLNQRPIKGTVCLFDVDNTLGPARQAVSAEMHQLLAALRHKVAIGYVSGSNLAKQQEQLGTPQINVLSLFDFCFPENGLGAYRMGVPLASQSFIGWLGEEKYKRLVKFCLKYISELDLPVMRGTFIEFRNGNVNISPVGRNASNQEREDYEKYDLEHGIRKTFVEALHKEFPDFGLTYSIGGQISFDVFPTGWDKTYCLQHIEADAKLPDGVKYDTIHFFGDKAFPGGNDYEIYEDKRTIGHAVKNPDETMRILRELFSL